MDGFNMMQAPARGSRREALPRRSAVTGPAARPSEVSAGGAPPIGSFMGFAGIDEEPEIDLDDWYENKKEHQNLACYSGVHIYLTDKGFGTVHKWCYTEMQGVLRLIQVKDEADYPAVLVQLVGTDPAGIEREVVFQSELPFNFKFDGGLSRTFAALELINGEWAGFLFSEDADKAEFVEKIADLHAKLTVTRVQCEALKLHVKETLKAENEAQLEEQIDCYNMLSGQDEDRRAQDLRKLLILAGLRVDTEMADPETVALIQKVIQDFDPNEAIDEDEAMFSARFTDFESRNRKGSTKGQGRVRQKATKRVSNAYHLERAKREKEEELKRLEREMRQQQTEELQKQFAKISEESNSLKEQIDQKKQQEEAEKQAKKDAKLAKKQASKKPKPEAPVKQKAAAPVKPQQQAPVPTPPAPQTQAAAATPTPPAAKARGPPPPPPARPPGWRPPPRGSRPRAPAARPSAPTSTTARPPARPAAPVRASPPTGAPRPPPPMNGPRPTPPRGAPRAPPAARGRGPARGRGGPPPPLPKKTAPAQPAMTMAEELAAQAVKMAAKAEAKAKLEAEGGGPAPKKKDVSQMTLAEQLQHQQEIMRQRAEAKAKGGNAKPAPKKELSFAEQLQEQQRIMREKAEAKKKAQAAGGQEESKRGSIQRKQTLAKIIAKEEKRMTDSQVAGTTLSFAEQLQQASKMLKPVDSIQKRKSQTETTPTSDPLEEKKAAGDDTENARQTVFSLASKINMALKAHAKSKMKQSRLSRTHGVNGDDSDVNMSDYSSSDSDDDSSD